MKKDPSSLKLFRVLIWMKNQYIQELILFAKEYIITISNNYLFSEIVKETAYQKQVA